MDSTPVVFEQEYFPEDELIYEELPYTVTKEDDMYVIEGPKIEKMLGYTNLDSGKRFCVLPAFLKRNGDSGRPGSSGDPGGRYRQNVWIAVRLL